MRQQHVVAGAHQLAAVAGLGRQPLGVGGPPPLLNEAFAVLLKGHGHGADGLLQRGVMAFANADGHGELTRPIFAGSLKINLADQREIAAGGRTELPLHAKMLHHVTPAVARSDKAATDAREAATGSHGQRPAVLPPQQHLVAGNIHGARGVARTSTVEVGRQERIYAEPRQQFRMSLEANIGEHHRVVRVADNLLGQAVTPVRIAVDITDPQGFRVEVFEGREQVALLFMGKGLAVGDQELHVPDLGAVDGGVVDLVQDAMGTGKPHPAGGRVGGAYGVFHA